MFSEAGVLGRPKEGRGRDSSDVGAVDGRLRNFFISGADGNGGVSTRSFPFPLAPRLKRAFNAPELFFNDKPDDLRSDPGVGPAAGTVLATPRLCCCSFCFIFDSFLENPGRIESIEGRMTSSDDRVPTGDGFLAISRWKTGRLPSVKAAASGTADGGVLRESRLGRRGVGLAFLGLSWSRDPRPSLCRLSVGEIAGAVLARSKLGRLGDILCFNGTMFGAAKRVDCSGAGRRGEVLFALI